MKKIQYIQLLIILWLCPLLIYSQYPGDTIKLDYTPSAGTISACQAIHLKPGFSFSASPGQSLILKIDPNVCTPYVDENMSLSTSQNYIVTVTPLDETDKVEISNNKINIARDTRLLTSVQYFDGLGRPVEMVQKSITPNKADLVTYQEYDSFGRDSIVWLPRASASNGAFVPLNSFKNLSKQIYQNDTKPFSQTVYESSPLNRIERQYGPGAVWNPNNNGTGGHPVSTNYLSNNNTDNHLKCAYYYLSGDNLARNNNYDPNQLYVTEILDEDNHISYQFKNKLDQVVLTRQITNNQNHDTYYVYDDFGNLRYMLPPLLADSLPATGAWNVNDTDANGRRMRNFAYIYKYDDRKRCIEKKLPGCASIHNVYDKADRLILSQDGNQRAKSPTEWTFNKYDTFGRVIISGVYSDTKDRSQLETEFKDSLIVESKGGAYGYSWIHMKRITDDKTLMVYHYDNYEHLLNQSSYFRNNLDYEDKSGYDKRYSSAKGLLVGTRVRKLDNSGEIVTAMYYDSKNRIVQKKSTNLLGGFDKEYYAYSFTGKLKETLKQHNITSPSNIATSELYKYTYDHAERLTTTTYTLNNNPPVVLAANTYDELGRLVEKKRHNNADTEQFEYNIRNWPTKIKSGDFVQNLYYNTNLPHSHTASPYYNGNISVMNWTYNNQTNGYMYYYDGLNRLTSNYSILNNVFQDMYQYSENFVYDKHGNIQNIFRYNNVDCIDALTFSYNGNQLKTISDSELNSNIYNLKEYKDKGLNPNKFKYDDNGNMIYDFDRNIVTIRYNLLNLPDTIQFGNGNQIINKYDYTGRKLSTSYAYMTQTLLQPLYPGDIIKNIVPSFGTDYIGNIRYGTSYNNLGGGNVSVERGIDMLFNPEGYATNISASAVPQYHYYRRDHLGNNREVWRADNNTTVQRTQYYPSGLPWYEGLNPSAQPYKYEGKEFIEMHGYDTYDCGARGYYPALGRPPTMDPLCWMFPEVSPYSWCKNNFPNRIDPDGRSDMWTDYYSPFGRRDMVARMTSSSKEEYIEQLKSNTREDKIITVAAVATVAAMVGVAALTEVLTTVATTSKGTAPDSKPNNENKRPGSKGNPDHQEKVKELAEKAAKENPDKRIVTEKKINAEGSNRRPDVQVQNPETKKTEKVYEAERNPNSQRNQKREEEYKKLRIPFETHKVGD